MKLSIRDSFLNLLRFLYFLMSKYLGKKKKLGKFVIKKRNDINVLIGEY